MMDWNNNTGVADVRTCVRAKDDVRRECMLLNARTVAASAGADAAIFEAVVQRLLETGESRVWKAREIIARMREQAADTVAACGSPEDGTDLSTYAAGYGKIILLGEHAVVYGRHAIAVPVSMAIRARAEDSADQATRLTIPDWGIAQELAGRERGRSALVQSLELILKHLGLLARPLHVIVRPGLPRANGLGGSAALAVAVIRALNRHCSLGLGDDGVCALAYECERLAHGTPSGIDNTVATYGQPLIYCRNEARKMRPLLFPRPLPMVIGFTGVPSLTALTVGKVRAAWQHNPVLYERIFDEIDTLALQGIRALAAWDLPQFGELMNVCQGQLNALQVSSPELEDMVQLARRNGALGAKLTGGGGGGAMIALCPDQGERVVRALQQAGYQATEVEVGSAH